MNDRNVCRFRVESVPNDENEDEDYVEIQSRELFDGMYRFDREEIREFPNVSPGTIFNRSSTRN